MELSINQAFDANLDHFWNMWFFDDAFFSARYANMRCKVLAKTVEQHPDRVQRTVRFVPDRNLPKPLERLLQGASVVQESSTYYPASGRCDVRVVLPVIGPKTDFCGSYHCRALTAERFERNWKGHVRVSLPLIGRLLEKFFQNELRQALADDHAFCNGWLKRNS